MLRLLLVLLFALVIAPPQTALAQTDADKTTARRLFFEARDAYDAKDYPKAVELFERSNQLYPAPTAALGLGRALVGAGQLVRAYETFTAISSQSVPKGASDPFKRAVSSAKKERSALESKLPSLVIRVTGPAEPVVSIDRQSVAKASLGVPRFVDPGEHVVVAAGSDFEEHTERVSVAAGETKTLDIELRALPKAKPALLPTKPKTPRSKPKAKPRPREDGGMNGMQTAGLVVGGVGALSLIAAAITGGLYLSKRSTVNDKCEEVASGEFLCVDEEGPKAAEDGRTLGLINAITLVGGVVASGAGITLYVIGSGQKKEVSLRASAAGASIRGAF